MKEEEKKKKFYNIKFDLTSQKYNNLNEILLKIIIKIIRFFKL